MHADGSGKRSRLITWERAPKAGTIMTVPGMYCQRSNELEWTDEELWRTYVMLTDLESVFLSLNSELSLRPIYHSSSRRAEGHLFTTVVSYQLVQVIRMRLRKIDLRSSWTMLKSIRWRQVRTTSIFETRDGYALHVRTKSQPGSVQREIYEAIGVNPVPHPKDKTTF